VAHDLSQLEQLRLEMPGADLTALAATIVADEDGARLAAALRSHDRPITAVVDAISAATGRGRLIDHPSESLRRTLDEELLPHLSAARHLVPLLAEAKRGGSYVIVGGPGGEAPWANYGFRSVAAAALRMMSCVLHEEARTFDVRVQMLSVATPVRGEVACRHECAEWPSAADIARHALQLIELRDGDPDSPTRTAPVAANARAVVRHAGGVESTAARTTSPGRTYRDVRSFLEALNSQERNEGNEERSNEAP
jgi:NAD(P)-dependent dehydrogenase (short-subunit alcohol dehydrogenase family)